MIRYFNLKDYLFYPQKIQTIDLKTKAKSMLPQLSNPSSVWRIEGIGCSRNISSSGPHTCPFAEQSHLGSILSCFIYSSKRRGWFAIFDGRGA